MTAGQPLTEYGLIGDGRTAALVSREGSVDWFCVPRFDSPSVFARLLDEDRGGCFELRAPGARATLAYEPGTNVLARTLEGPAGAARGWDFLPWPPQGPEPPSRLVRLLEGQRGSLDVEMRFAPRPEYALYVPRMEAIEGGVAARAPGLTVLLAGDRPLEVGAGEAVARFALRAGERAAFVVGLGAPDAPAGAPDLGGAWGDLPRTLDAWRRWDARTRFEGPYKERVRRSALVLKLLQHEPTGGIVAAPTTSLPEAAGGVRNWDYRYVWLRDAWLLSEALYLVGHPTQAGALLEWVLGACNRSAPELRIMYGLTPGSMPPEQELAHLAGWRGSKPVRIGNAAREQFQLDAYGQLLGCLHRCRLIGKDLREEAWGFLRDAAEMAAARRREPDCGIWEFRSEPQHFVHSKVMAWVALDRAAKAVREVGLPGPVDRWERDAADLRAEVLERGWSRERGAFVQSYGSPHLDAANLVMPIVGFLDAADPRMVATVERIQEELCDGPFVRRYTGDDGLPGEEGAFLFCSFWLVDNLALQGRVAEARALFDDVLDHAGPLGLLSEEIDPRTGELLGNYPQGFSHIGLIRSALLLEDLRARALAAPAEGTAGG